MNIQDQLDSAKQALVDAGICLRAFGEFAMQLFQAQDKMAKEQWEAFCLVTISYSYLLKGANLLPHLDVGDKGQRVIRVGGNEINLDKELDS
jgi:hypothetical protein